MKTVTVTLIIAFLLIFIGTAIVYFGMTQFTPDQRDAKTVIGLVGGAFWGMGILLISFFLMDWYKSKKLR